MHHSGDPLMSQYMQVVTVHICIETVLTFWQYTVVMPSCIYFVKLTNNIQIRISNIINQTLMKQAYEQTGNCMIMSAVL